MSKGIALRLQETYGQLRKSERVVADYLRGHQSERLEMSITELSNTLRVSPQSIKKYMMELKFVNINICMDII